MLLGFSFYFVLVFVASPSSRVFLYKMGLDFYWLACLLVQPGFSILLTSVACTFVSDCCGLSLMNRNLQELGIETGQGVGCEVGLRWGWDGTLGTESGE